MSRSRIALAVIFSVLYAAAFAQTPGAGETRPLPRDDRKVPATEAQKPPTPEPEAERELKRCEDFNGTLRDDCIRESRAAEGKPATGATQRPEPPTAPPPNNPIGR